MRIHVYFKCGFTTKELTHKQAKQLIGEESFKKHVELFKQGRRNNDFVEYMFTENNVVLYMWE